MSQLVYDKKRSFCQKRPQRNHPLIIVIIIYSIIDVKCLWLNKNRIKAQDLRDQSNNNNGVIRCLGTLGLVLFLQTTMHYIC
jgi:hypothetical protein